MAADELACTVADGIGPCCDGVAFQMAADITGELLGGAVAALGLLPEGHQEDRVEIALKLPDQAVGRGSARRGRNVGADSVLGNAHGITGASRLAMAHAIPQLLDAARPKGVRPAPEQPVQHHAESVDVAGGSNLATGELLRAGIFGRQRLKRGKRVVEAERVGVEQLGNPEIEQLYCAIGCDQDIGRLDIAVDHEVLVRVVDCRADCEE
jgi:hypothetical protein